MSNVTTRQTLTFVLAPPPVSAETMARLKADQLLQQRLAYQEAHTGVADPRLRSRFYPTPTAEENQAWLAAHPEEAQKAEGYEPVTLIPFWPGAHRGDDDCRDGRRWIYER